MDECVKYSVRFVLPTENTVQTRTVVLWDGYSEFSDIPRILATTYYGQPERGGEIKILSAEVL